MQIPLVDGRGFTLADEAGAPAVLVNERLVKTFYPNTNPIGRRLRPPFGNPLPPWFTIVGVVKDVKQGGLDEETGTEIYFLTPQVGATLGFVPRTMYIVIRTKGEPLALAGVVRNVVRELDPALPGGQPGLAG
jgi:hypothetical protein